MTEPVRMEDGNWIMPGKVHGVVDVAGLQEAHELVRRHDRAVLLGFFGAGPEMRRQAHPRVVRQARHREVGYTTILKLMQIMIEKGHVTRDESRRSHVYQAKLKRSETQRQLVGVLLDKAFNGATGQLVLQAINTKKLSHDEIADVRKLLDDIESS